MKKSTYQILIATFIVGFWIVSAIVAVFAGDELLKVTTPLMTLALGWIFAAEVTRN